MKFDTPRVDTVVVTFDDAKTQLPQILTALRKGGIKPLGKPVYLEREVTLPGANATPPGPDRTSRSGTGS